MVFVDTGAWFARFVSDDPDHGRVTEWFADEIHRAWILFQTMSAMGMSFTDCTSKVVMDQLGIHTVMALDDHFCRFGTWTVVP